MADFEDIINEALKSPAEPPKEDDALSGHATEVLNKAKETPYNLGTFIAELLANTDTPNYSRNQGNFAPNVPNVAPTSETTPATKPKTKTEEKPENSTTLDDLFDALFSGTAGKGKQTEAPKADKSNVSAKKPDIKDIKPAGLQNALDAILFGPKNKPDQNERKR